MNARLALGTAQFGLDYGINNKRGRIPPDEVFDILRYGWENGIRVLDTAFAYQDSEKLIGDFIERNHRDFKIVSKLPSEHVKDARKGLDASLNDLKLKRIYGYLLHHFHTFIEDKDLWAAFTQMKQQKKVEKIGFSLYRTEDLEYLLVNNIAFDIVQVPLSILDQRFVPYLKRLKEKKIEVHVRSVFLQGLVFKDSQELAGRFAKVKDKVAALNALAAEHNIPVAALCLNFVVGQDGVDEVIVGVDRLANLKENVKALEFQQRTARLMPRLANLSEEDEEVILPTNWK